MILEDSIHEILSEAGIDFRLINRSFVLDCPVCGKKDKINIERNGGYYICYVCSDENTPNSKGKKVEYLLSSLTNIPVKEVQRQLYGVSYEAVQKNNLSLEFYDEKEPTLEKEEEKVEIPMSYIPITDLEAQNGKIYLISRGIPTVVAQEYGIMYSEFYRRILFPVFIDNELKGYQTRTIDQVTETNIKAYSSKGTWRSKYVMFYDRLKNSKHAIISEGPIDAIKAHLVGGNIATLGKHVTIQQLDSIKQSGIKKLYIALDEDALSGVPEIARNSGVETFIVMTPPGRDDLGDSTPKEVLKAFQEAKPVSGTNVFLKFKD